MIPLSTGLVKQFVWAGILPSLQYLIVCLLPIIGLITPLRMNFIRNIGISRMFLAFFRAILHAVLCFLTGLTKAKKGLILDIFYPIITSLIFLLASVLNYSNYEFGIGFVIFAWSLDFLAFHILDRFVTSS
jgi:hypothetical protein